MHVLKVIAANDVGRAINPKTLLFIAAFLPQFVVLDGGLAAWTESGGALSTDPSERPAKTLTAALRPELIADRDEVRRAIDDERVHLIDSLPAASYQGQMVMYDRPGHITSAENISRRPTSMLKDRNHFAPSEKKAKFSEGPTAPNPGPMFMSVAMIELMAVT